MREEEVRLEQNEENEPVVSQTVSVAPVRIKRRRRIRYAAPLGFLVLLFALIGVISVIVTAIGWIVKANDDTALREELYTFLDPVMQFCPSEFESVDTTEDTDPLLLAAVYRVSEAERIRQLRERDEECAYPIEETQYRMIVPQTTIYDSYQYLFGKAEPTHRTIGDVEYKADNSCYYVPMSINTSGYTPVLGKITHKNDRYTVQVAYVSNADIQYDERGNSIAPTVDMAKYSQRYTVMQNEDGSWTLLSVSADK